MEVLGAPGSSHSTGRSLVELTLWSWSIKIIRYFPRMLIVSLWPTPLHWSSPFPVHLCVTKPTLPIPASTCVWKELLDQLQLSHRPRTKNPATGLKPAEDGKIPRTAILYRHTRQIEIEKETNRGNKLRRRAERRNKQRGKIISNTGVFSSLIGKTNRISQGSYRWTIEEKYLNRGGAGDDGWGGRR